jgi:hypothetical protein
MDRVDAPHAAQEDSLEEDVSSSSRIRFELFEQATTLAFALFGAWALYAQIHVAIGSNFLRLKQFSFLPFLALAAVLLYVRRFSCSGNEEHDADTPALQFPPPPLWYMVAAPAGVVAVFLVTRSDWLLWALGSIHLGLLAFSAPSSPPHSQKDELPAPLWELLAVAGICFGAVIITLGARRPDADDGYFLNAVVSAIDFPRRPLFLFDGMHKSGFPPVEQSLHLFQVYELFVALSADVTGISTHALYYLVFPAIFACLTVIAFWLVLRHFLSSLPAVAALLGMVAIYIFWGDGHTTYGNNGFVRLFQGKTIFRLALLPMIIHAALQYRKVPTVRNWLYLMLYQAGAVGLTSSALMVAPLAAGLALVALPHFTRSYWKRTLAGVSSSLPLFIFALIMYVRLLPYPDSRVRPIIYGCRTALGDVRTPLALLALLFLPALALRARVRDPRWVTGYVWVSFLVIFSPLVARLLTEHIAHNFAMRIFWAFPAPLLLSLLVGILASDYLPHRHLRVILLLAGLAVFAFAGGSAVTMNNWSLSNMNEPKVNAKAYEAAQKTMEIAPPGGLIVATERVAIVLSGFHHAPPISCVRGLYLGKLRGILPDEVVEERIALNRYIDNAPGKLSAHEATRLIEKLDCRTVVFPASHRDAHTLTYILQQNGFTFTICQGYLIGVRASSTDQT